jgi:periplasmic divalent cation tolerance protein
MEKLLENGRILEGQAMEDCKDPDIWTVTTTVGSLPDAQALARALLARGLAACVQLDAGVQSFYRWEGKDCEDPEVRLTIKTTAASHRAVAAAFAELHPYDLPQFVAWPAAAASEAYAAWVRAAVK